jgi:CRP-like cAMP-binding protein
LVLAYVVASPALRRAVEQERAATAGARSALIDSGLTAGLPSSGVDRLARQAEPVSLPDGEVVIGQGERADALYVLASGRVLVTQQEVAGLVATLEAPDVFGELGVVRGAPRNATVTSDGPVEVWRIDAEDFLAAMDRLPTLPPPLTAVMERRLTSGRS